MMKRKLLGLIALLLSLGLHGVSVADEPGLDEPAAPESDHMDPMAPAIPTLEEISTGSTSIENFVPMDFDFRIGVIGDFNSITTVDEVEHSKIYTPFIMIDPRTGRTSVQAKNFPARVVANSPDGRWAVAIAPSSAVEGTSGSASKEAAVLLNVQTGEITLIQEFPLHSNFQALFTRQDSESFYYCSNEPGAINQLVKYNIERLEGKPVPVEGNRFYMYGIREQQPLSIWVRDPLSTESYPVLSLIDLQNGSKLAEAAFPSANEVIAQPGGAVLMSAVRDTRQASIAYYETQEQRLHQVQGLVFDRPSFKWLNNGLEIIAKENSAVSDRFVRVNLVTGEKTELFDARFKISLWDVSDDDKALIFITDGKVAPMLFVLSLDPSKPGMNRIKLRDMSDIRWIGCLYPFSEGGGLLDRLLPKF